MRAAVASALPSSVSGRVAAVLYVAVVTTLAAVGTLSPNDAGNRFACWVVAALLTLPALVPLFPFVYVGGGTAWSVSGADSGGPEWVVTLVYTAMLTVVAVVNVGLLHLGYVSWRARRRQREPLRTG